MHRLAPQHWALAAVAVVTASTVAFALTGSFEDPPQGLAAAASDAEGAEPAAGAAPSHDHVHAPGTSATHTHGGRGHTGPYGLDAETPLALVHTPPFPLEEGKVPTRTEALDFEARYSRFVAKGTEGLDELAQEGHLAGAGTQADPYVLDSFYVKGDLTIQSTDRAIILRNGYVDGQLSLNYIGKDLYVHHVYAKDLRINENVERSGANTGGLFHDNTFGFVGQIRHFIGEFRHNTVGPTPDGIVTTYLSDTGVADVPEGVVFNFDGFHGADVHHNTFHGQVDIKLHGHNHADCLACPVHDHADEAEHPDTLAKEGKEHTYSVDPQLGFRSRHSVRYHSLLFRDNTIQVDDAPFALRYNDRNHAGDDQTANSEPNQYLEDPHVHYQHIALRDNTITGAAVLLDIFNAEDDRHVIQNTGILEIAGNTITIPYLGSDDGVISGIDARDADGIQLRIRDNKILFDEVEDGMPLQTIRNTFDDPPMRIGIFLYTFALGDVLIEGNHVNEGDYGVFAGRLAAAVFWDLVGNDFQTEEVYRSQGTTNDPGQRPEGRGEDGT